MLKYLVIIMVLVACSGTPAPTPTAPAITTAWVAGGDLYIWQAGETRQIVTGNVLQAYLAPGLTGTNQSIRIAFTRGADVLPETLWLWENEQATQIENTPVFIHQVAWAGDRLYFNTMESAAGQIAPLPRDDLYYVDADHTVKAAPIGGYISISPGHQNILISKPGTYDETPGEIWLLEPLTRLINFPAVATGSHFSFYPEIHWINEVSAWVALPDADAVYSEFTPEAPPIALWRITLQPEPSAQQMGTLQASFFGLPVWNTQGRMAYLRRSSTSPDFDLYIEDTLYAADVLTRPFWFDERIIYAKSDGYYRDDEYWLNTPVLQFMTTRLEILYITFNEQIYEIRYAGEGDERIIAQIDGTRPILAGFIAGD